MSIIVRPYAENDRPRIIQLIAEFRVALAKFKSLEKDPNLEVASDELNDYQGKGYPIFIAESDGHIVGYLVCRIDEDVVWGESLYISPNFRYQGIGSALYSEAEQLAENLGGDTVYNWVQPNNHVIISFLKKRGYTVLNLVEIRRPRKGEILREKIQVGKYEFDY